MEYTFTRKADDEEADRKIDLDDDRDISCAWGAVKDGAPQYHGSGGKWKGSYNFSSEPHSHDDDVVDKLDDGTEGPSDTHQALITLSAAYIFGT